MSKIGLRQSISIYVQNNQAKFRHDPILNDGALGFLKKKKKKKKKRKRKRKEAILDQFVIQKCHNIGFII